MVNGEVVNPVGPPKMLEKYKFESGKDTSLVLEELSLKINELVEATNSRLPVGSIRTRRVPNKQELVGHMETMLLRMQTGPLTMLSQEDPNSEPIGKAMTTLREVLASYKAGLKQD